MIRGLLVVAALALAGPAQASGLVIPASVFVGAQVLDLHSTAMATGRGYGREANAVMGDGTGARAIILKAGVTAGVLAAARRMDRRGHPRAAKVTLYVFAGVVGGVAAHNYRLARHRR